MKKKIRIDNHLGTKIGFDYLAERKKRAEQQSSSVPLTKGDEVDS